MSTSNIFSNVFIYGNCTVQGTFTSLGGSAVSQWTTSGSTIYYSSGNVGIGTTNPQNSLTVYNSGVSISNLSSGTTSTAAYYAVVNTADNRRAFVGMDGTGLFAFSTGALALGTDNTPIIFAPSYGSGEKMRILTNGYVGIGTTNPGSLLTVSGGVGIGSGYNAFTAPTGGLIVQGNVGIGKTNPGTALDVNGTVTATTVVATTYYGALAGSNTGTFSNIYSANALVTTNLFANTLTLANASSTGPTLGVTGNAVFSSTVTQPTSVSTLGSYVGGQTLASVGQPINTFTASYPNFLVTGGSQFYFNDSATASTLKSTAGAGAQFGYSVAFSADGNTALVGAPNASTTAGYAAVFRYSGGSWGSASPLTSTAGSFALFGYSIALSADGNTALVGAPAGNSYRGYAAVYRYSGGSWGSASPLTGTTGASGQFGSSVALSADGNTALVGGFYGAGYAAVFRYSGGSWGSASTLASTAGAASNFGNAVALSADGNTALVGAPGASTTAGYAAVYTVGSKFQINNTLAVYNNQVGIGRAGVGNVTSLTETLTVSGNTSFIGSVTQVTDASSNNYVNAKRVPAGSLSVANYVTGSVPLTTTTNLIQNYLSNAAAVVTNAPTYNPVLSLPNTPSSWVQIPYQSAVTSVNTSNIFIEAWIYQTATPATTVIANSQGTGDDWGFRTVSGSLQFFIYNTVAAAYINTYPTTMSTSSWQYVAMSFTGSNTTPFIYTFVGGTSGTATIAGNGLGTQFVGTPRLQIGNNLAIGGRGSELFQGYIYDLRIYKGTSIIKTASFACPATPTPFGLSQPAYITGNAPTLHISLQSQYFPGASTSPYGPCLTLPGTLGSYYQQSTTAVGANWKTYGFTLEAWVNYASLANSNVYYSSAPLPYCLAQTLGGNLDWGFGPTTTGALSFFTASNTPSAYYSLTSPVNSIVTGQWTHIAVQVSLTAISLYVNGVIQTLTAWNFVNGGTSTASSIPTTIPQLSVNGLTVGQWNATGGLNANFAIARARLVYGTVSQVGNVYNMSGFTVSPNLGTVPSGATVAWQLDTQYPLPTFPSIQDVTELPQQATSYGSLPTPVGGVTSNVLSPYTGTQLNSIRFDGTGYIDYGNAATSVMTSNIWASPWTIEGWVYFPTANAAGAGLARRGIFGTASYDWDFYLAGSTFAPVFNYGSVYVVSVVNPSAGSWNHMAATYDGANANVYINGTLGRSLAVTPAQMTFNPSYQTVIGVDSNPSSVYFPGNLADLRVSNVARYTGSSYTVPNVADGSGPFKTDANTLLLLKSLGGQVGTTLEVQGRGLNAVSLGATRSVQSYPPAPMSSYLLDTTGNTAVTYGQGKYVASASSEYGTLGSTQNPAYGAFDKQPGSGSTVNYWASTVQYSSSSYTGSVATVDTIGNSYAGEWVQLQMPVSIILSSYSLQNRTDASQGPVKLYILGSRDGTNWTLVNSQSGVPWTAVGQTLSFSTQATQGYNFYRLVTNQVVFGAVVVSLSEWTLNGTEESLCITSDSKVGVGIANPQRALEVAGDLVVSGTISGGAGLGGFRNRIINGDMRIAQRGTSFTTSGGATTYTVDRWNTYIPASGGTYTINQQLLTSSDTPSQMGFSNCTTVTVVSAPASGASLDNSVFGQGIEGYNMQDWNWGTSFGVPVTISFWFKSNFPQGSVISVSVRNYTGTRCSYVAPVTVTGPGVWQYVTITVPPPPNSSTWGYQNNGSILFAIAYYNNSGVGTNVAPLPNVWYNGSNYVTNAGAYPWVFTAGNFITLTGVQLEKGTVATPFEVRPYATELALCQRYYQISGSSTGGGIAYLNYAISSVVKFPVVMRVTPQFTLVSNALRNSATATNSILTTPTLAINQNGYSILYEGTGAPGISPTLTVGMSYDYSYTVSAEL